ncbi:hypothetical protein EDD99_1840 [Streptomyces sp. 846.5]|nr:hypothetical protein [Streptomyces sp. 846.5]TDU03415.1 hypothetical protein EDD99_1840 [Streptomyces sp. 846.5]
MSREIKRQLRESAQAYQPDHDRMAARVRRGAVAPVIRHRSRSRARSGPRAVLVGLAAALGLATGGFAVAAIVQPSPSPSAGIVGPATAVPSPTPSARSAAPTPTSAAPSSGSAVPSASPSSLPSASASAAASQLQSGPLRSAGSVSAHSSVYWEENDVTLSTTSPLTSLTVEVHIALTAAVRETGTWRTLPSDDFTVTVQRTISSLVFRWVLKPGLTVQVGQHEFAAQFNHITGARSAAADSYRVDAGGVGGTGSVWGGFTGR